jgi:hypothetical protein
MFMGYITRADPRTLRDQDGSPSGGETKPGDVIVSLDQLAQFRKVPV